MRVYSALFNDFYPLNTWYPEATLKRVSLPHELNHPGILVIWGGEDIHPSLYGRPNRGSYVSATPSSRDVSEWNLMQRAIDLKFPILGVCRGAQMGCAAAGGILIQDVLGHGRGHSIETNDGQILYTTSCHHQMMYPWNVKHELLAWTRPSFSWEQETGKHYQPLELGTLNGGLTDDECKLAIEMKQPEIVWFPTIKCLAVQGHPEWMDEQCPFNTHVKGLIDEFLITP